MSRRAAMRYLVYGYIGERTRDNTTLVNPLHIDKSKHGFMFCIYDSEQEAPQDETAFPYGPSTPAIKDPRFKIEESSAGSMEFTLLCDGSSMVFYNPGTQGSSMTPRTGVYERLYNYMLPKQTEIVLYRSIKKTNGYETKELWSGRVDTIKKDFSNNWSIYCEGALSYFNDVALAELKLTNAINPQQIMTTLIGKHNQRISAIHTLHPNITVRLPNPSNPSVISIYQVPELPREFNIGIIDIDALPAVATGSNMDNSFTISDGSTVWNNLTTMLDNYGGHLEVYKDKSKSDTLYIDWKKNGKYNEESDTYTWDGYHKFVAGTSQVIEFGKNLLDFSEEFDTSGLYTVLIPHGQATTSTVTDKEGKEKTVTGPALTVKDVNGGSIYVYDQKKVDTYGWIEKVETWNISEPNSLLAMAKAYYKDLRIGARSITIKAFDLKNLIYNTEAEPDQNKLLAFDALYLYDVIKVNSMVHASRKRELGDDTQYMPIKGITIPLDKFPTDTEYIISNGMKKRDILSPGRVGEKPKEVTPQPEVDPGDDPPTPNPEEEPTPTVRPIGSVLGIDGDFVHYPPIYLDRQFSYLRSELGMASGYITEDYDIPEQDYVQYWDSRNQAVLKYKASNLRSQRVNSTRTVRFKPDPNGPTFVGKFTKSSLIHYEISMIRTFFGFNSGDAVNVVSAESPTTITKKPGAVFYTDDITNGLAAMRRRSNLENQTNYFEHIFDDTIDTGEHTVAELASFITGKANYYRTVTDANVDTTQTWFAHGGSADDSKITWSDDSRYNPGTAASEIINKIRSRPCMGGTVADALNGIGIVITADDMETNFLSITMTYQPDSVSEHAYTIKHKLNQYRPTDLANEKYYYSVGVLDLGTSAVLYLAYYIMNDVTLTPAEQHTKEVMQKYIDGQYISLGVTPGTPPGIGLLNGPDAPIAWYKTETDSSTGISYYVAASSDDPQKIGTPLQLACHAGWDSEHQAQSMGYLFANEGGLAKITKQGYSNRIFDKMADAAFMQSCFDDYWATDSTVNEQKNILNKVKAKTNAIPFLVLTKTTSPSEQDPARQYGAFFICRLENDTTISIAKPSGKDYYVFNGAIGNINRNVSGTPIMITHDTLTFTNYFFTETPRGDEITISNASPLPTFHSDTMSQAPTMCLARCGGNQTSHTAVDAFFPLCGDTSSSKAIASDCIWPQKLTAPKTRSEIQTEADGNVNRIWYHGPDMKKKSDYTETTSDAYLNNANEGDISKFFINTSTRQPLVLGGRNFVKVTPNLYLRKNTSDS